MLRLLDTDQPARAVRGSLCNGIFVKVYITHLVVSTVCLGPVQTGGGGGAIMNMPFPFSPKKTQFVSQTCTHIKIDNESGNRSGKRAVTTEKITTLSSLSDGRCARHGS